MFAPEDTPAVVATLTKLLRWQGRKDLADLLSVAHARFDDVDRDDSWNGGITYWELQLEIPVDLFADVESKLPEYQTDLEAKLKHFIHDNPGNSLRGVHIFPALDGEESQGQRTAPAEAEVNALWGLGRFRLFISHVATHRVAAKSIKEALEIRGVQAFVAHDDIEPTQEWQDQIEIALKSMHAMAALITPDFHPSNWTDQEVGWALGRGVVVVPVRLKANPYGFIQKIQGVAGDLAFPKRLAADIVTTLLSNPRTHGELRRAVLHAIAHATSAASAKVLSELVGSLPELSDDEKKQLWDACQNNRLVRTTEGVVAAIYSAAGQPQVVNTDDDIPF